MFRKYRMLSSWLFQPAGGMGVQLNQGGSGFGGAATRQIGIPSGAGAANYRLGIAFWHMRSRQVNGD
jgi:hypothetical protein